MNCAICGIRKPKRHCPALHADICSVCCGTEREQTVDCPLVCEYLHQAHAHEREPPADVLSGTPNSDYKLTEEFLRENEMALFFLGSVVFEGVIESAGATDYDAREALEALIRTYQAADSGLYYETRPVNPFASAIYQKVQTRVSEIRKLDRESGPGALKMRDSVILGLLIFFQRLEYTHNNGRKRSRAYLDVLRTFYVEQITQMGNTPEPDAPRIIL